MSSSATSNSTETESKVIDQENADEYQITRNGFSQQAEDDENEDYYDGIENGNGLSDAELEAQLNALNAEVEAEKARTRRAGLIASIEAAKAQVNSMRQRRSHVERDNQVTPAKSASRKSISTPFTDGRPDFYLAGIQHPRRRTLAFLDHVFDSDDSLEPAHRRSQHTARSVENPLSEEPSMASDAHARNGCIAKPVSVPVPIPREFTGDEPDFNKLRAALMEFLADLEGYVTYSYTSKGHTPTPYDWLTTAVRFLKGSAAGVYRDQLVIAREELENGERDHDLTWQEVRQALIDHFGRPQDGYELILDMFEMKQEPNESVKQFSDRFHTNHMELTRLGLASRDLSSALYIHALKSEIRNHVKEHIATHDFFKVNAISQKKPRSAIQALQRFATARESTIRAKQNSQSNSSAQPKPGNAKGNTQSNASGHSNGKGQPNNQAGRQQRPMRNVTETHHSIPDDLYKARAVAGLCVRCNSDQHKGRDCDKPRNLTPVPAALLRARLHALQAAYDESPVQAPANNNQPKNH